MCDPVPPIYQTITVQLTGMDGNAFFIIGRVRSALRRAKVPDDKVTEFVNEASSGDYDHVLQTAMKWVNVQ